LLEAPYSGGIQPSKANMVRLMRNDKGEYNKTNLTQILSMSGDAFLENALVEENSLAL